MRLLQRVLLLMALVWAVSGAAVVVAPGFVLVTLFDMPEPPDFGYVRVAGMVSFSLALLMVMISRRLAELWWFVWAFVIAAAGTAVIAAGTAMFGLPQGASPVLWWVFAAMSAGLTVALLAGLAKTGTERPPI